MLKGFHSNWYARNNVILTVVVDVDLAAALAKIKRFYEPIPRRAVPGRPKIQLQPVKPTTIAIDSDLLYGIAAVAYRLPGYDDPDFAAGVVLADALDSRRGDLYGVAAAGRSLGAGFDASALPKAGFGYAHAEFPPGKDSSTLIAEKKKIIEGIVKRSDHA